MGFESKLQNVKNRVQHLAELGAAPEALFFTVVNKNGLVPFHGWHEMSHHLNPISVDRREGESDDDMKERALEHVRARRQNLCGSARRAIPMFVAMIDDEYINEDGSVKDI